VERQSKTQAGDQINKWPASHCLTLLCEIVFKEKGKKKGGKAFKNEKRGRKHCNRLYNVRSIQGQPKSTYDCQMIDGGGEKTENLLEGEKEGRRDEVSLAHINIVTFPCLLTCVTKKKGGKKQKKKQKSQKGKKKKKRRRAIACPRTSAPISGYSLFIRKRGKKKRGKRVLAVDKGGEGGKGGGGGEKEGGGRQLHYTS